jgi:hypothetical protein
MKDDIEANSAIYDMLTAEAEIFSDNGDPYVISSLGRIKALIAHEHKLYLQQATI